MGSGDLRVKSKAHLLENPGRFFPISPILPGTRRDQAFLLTRDGDKATVTEAPVFQRCCCSLLPVRMSCQEGRITSAWPIRQAVSNSKALAPQVTARETGPGLGSGWGAATRHLVRTSCETVTQAVLSFKIRCVFGSKPGSGNARRMRSIVKSREPWGSVARCPVARQEDRSRTHRNYPRSDARRVNRPNG